jgi:MerR family transcriptional regulator, copper efflux regulator
MLSFFYQFYPSRVHRTSSQGKKNQSGYRLYDEVSVEKLEFIIRAKSLGLTLDEIKKILQLYDSGEVPCECTRQFIKNKIRDTEEKIAALNNLNTKLRKLLRLERDKTAKSICPIITGESKKGLTLHWTG